MKAYRVIFFLLSLIFSFKIYSQDKIIVGPEQQIQKIYTNGNKIAYECVKERDTPLGIISEKFFVYNGIENGPYDNITHVSWSEEKELITYLTSVDGQLFVNLEKERFGPYEEIRHFDWVPKSDKISFVYKEKGVEWVFNGNEVIGPYHYIIDLKWAPTGEIQ